MDRYTRPAPIIDPCAGCGHSKQQHGLTRKVCYFLSSDDGGRTFEHCGCTGYEPGPASSNIVLK